MLLLQQEGVHSHLGSIKKEGMSYYYQLKIIQLGLLRQGLIYNSQLLEIERIKTGYYLFRLP